jgi:uncharacterized protein (DUF1778 family)
MKKKENKIQIRITDEAKAIIKEKAELKKITISEYIQNYKFKVR